MEMRGNFLSFETFPPLEGVSASGSNRFAKENFVFVAIVCLSAFCGTAFMTNMSLAFEGPSQNGPSSRFANPQDAFKYGLKNYESGEFDDSVAALKYAASQGHPLAQWKLGRMYADGDGVPRDDAQAYSYFSSIVSNFHEDDDDELDRKDLAVVSNAYVAVGVYALNGLPKAKVEPDPARAFAMFQFAAMTFGDPNAQYNLARMLLDGRGCEKDPRQAARWFNLAAEKQHHAAQALLGHMLFFGQGVQQQKGRGLMWLTLARDSAVSPKDKWILDLYSKALENASDDDRQISDVYLHQYSKAAQR